MLLHYGLISVFSDKCLLQLGRLAIKGFHRQTRKEGSGLGNLGLGPGRWLSFATAIRNFLLVVFKRVGMRLWRREAGGALPEAAD